MTEKGWDPVTRAIKSRIAAAKASGGFTWEAISSALKECDIDISPSNLMSKHSRGSFKLNELVVLLRLLDVGSIDLKTLQIQGLDQARRHLSKQAQRHV